MTPTLFFSEKAINDSFRHASRLKWEKEKSMMDKLDYTQFKLFLRILRMTYNFYEVYISTFPIPIPTIRHSIIFKAFNYIDSDGEHVIDRDTFCEDATKKVLERWLGPREDWA